MRPLLAILLVVGMLQPLAAQSKNPPKGKTAKPAAKILSVRQEADQLEYDDKSKIMRLKGRVKLTQGETALLADEAVYYLNTEQAEASGRIRLMRPDSLLTGDHLRLYYRLKHAFFDGRVALTRFPRTDEKLNKSGMVGKKPVRIWADELDYRWDSKITAARGHVVLAQGDRKAFADSGVFNGAQNRLEMQGNVTLLRPPKDKLSCDHLVYLLNTDQAKADGHVRGEFTVREEPEQKPEKGAEGIPPAGPASGSPKKL